jgi:8-oxo-dGTP pyrophosphatase MutT (NUDIX family)
MKIPSPFYRVSVKALVLDEQQRLLVVREGDTYWEIPGGGWEHGETLEQCVHREIQEELGVGVRRIDTRGMLPWVGSAGGDEYQRLKLTVSVELDSQDFQLGDGMTATRYVTPAELASLPMHNGEEALQAELVRAWPVG